MKYYLGVDPGKTGAVAVIDENSDVHYVVQMPETIADIWEVFEEIKTTFKPLRSCIEYVSTTPQMGIKSAGTFMMNKGVLHMGLAAARIPYEQPTPRTWQKALGVPVKKATETQTQHKNKLKGRAQELFPTEKITLATADALLIAEYCRRTKKNGND